MSRISDRYLKSVHYLFFSEEEARSGRNPRGTCFLYGVPVTEEAGKVFVVTCRHLLANPEIYLRINAKGEGFKILSTKRQDWLISSSEDLAVYLLPYDDEYDIGFVRQGIDTATQELVESMDIGPGDEVFVIGLFVSHSGQFRNTPVVRFGNIAMMPYEPIFNSKIGLEVMSYLVDIRLRAGFSGSPVFVKYSFRFSRKGNITSGPWFGEKLLGISWGGFEEKQSVMAVNSQGERPLLDYVVPLSEGLAFVTPVERIDELIDGWGRRASFRGRG